MAVACMIFSRNDRDMRCFKLMRDISYFAGRFIIRSYSDHCRPGRCVTDPMDSGSTYSRYKITSVDSSIRVRQWLTRGNGSLHWDADHFQGSNSCGSDWPRQIHFYPIGDRLLVASMQLKFGPQNRDVPDHQNGRTITSFSI